MRNPLKRWLFLTHRWLAIVACAFFALWFVSGVVMMYVGYPRLTDAERLQHLPPLADTRNLLAPRAALAAAGLEGPLQDLRLAVASGGRAAYLVVPRGERSAVVIDAETGEVLRSVSAAHALASATAYARHSADGAARVQYLGTIDEDAYTHSRALDAHRPLHRVQLHDAAATRLYISGRTGEVVRDASRTERVWNYAGAWIHWLYPFRGIGIDRYWADIVNTLSLVGIAVALTGAAVGVMRWRFAGRYRSGSRSPYPGRMMRWHHISGLLFAVVTLTWMFSGLMSMNPWRMFDNGAPPLHSEALQGGPLHIDARDAAPHALLAAAGGAAVRELRWTRTLGTSLVQARSADTRPALIDSHSAQPRTLDPAAVHAAAARLLSEPVLRIEQLDAYDLHYYARAPHTMSGGADRPLPALRVVFGDERATWVHIDPHTGAVLGRTDDTRRVRRWLFAMLHSWDWLPLLERRPLWDIVMVVLSLGGTLLSVTGVVIGWRRLRVRLRLRRAPRATRATRAVPGTSVEMEHPAP